MNWRRILPRAK